jgi:para-nitrobenzyl esterase
MKLNRYSTTVVLFCFFANLLTAQLKIIKTANGLIQGTAHDAISIFKGIPFAAPPTGNLRWKAPEPASNWKGIRQCSTFSASPFQPTPVPFLCWSEEFIAPPVPLSEDCLYLNVWTGAKNNKEKRPVFVWIYGGGFSSGSAACAIYDGEEMAKKGIVFVSINYRVGPFGFMAHPELSKEQNNASGNYGILDQLAALQWVQKNITAFGGDPGRVTVAGQSAGSMSVNALLASPLAKGLFQQAILQSGSFLGNFLPPLLHDAEANGIALQKKTGAADINELRNKPADEILKAAQSAGRMGLTLDNYVLPTNILNNVKTNNYNNVPLMMGWVTGDAMLFGKPTITAEKFIQQANEKYGADASEYLTVFTAANNEEAQQSQAKITLMNFAAYPAHLLGSYNSKPVFIYESSYVPADKPDFPNYGAFHTSEVPFALHTLHVWKRPWQKNDYDVQKLMNAYWVSFIKTGNPNAKGLPAWHAYDKTGQSILEISTNTAMHPALYKKEFDVLDKLQTKK